MLKKIILIAGILFLANDISKSFFPYNSMNIFSDIPEAYVKNVNYLLEGILETEAMYTLLSDFKPISTVNVRDGFSIYTMRGLFDEGDGVLVEKERIIVPRNLNDAKIRSKKVYDSVEFYKPILSALCNEQFHFQFLSVKAKKAPAFVTSEKIEYALMPDILVINKAAVKKLLTEKKDFFNSINISTDSATFEQILQFFTKHNHGNNTISSSDRTRALGYLYGYPDYAVDFFVKRMEIFQREWEERERKGDTLQLPPPPQDREFIRIPCYGEGNYTYAVPINKGLNKEDIELKMNAEKVLLKYKEYRNDLIAREYLFNAMDFLNTWE